jgi:hypothetical protein
VNPNILKEEIRSLLSSDLLFTWHQDTHLAEPIYYNIQIVMTPFDIGKPPTKSMEILSHGWDGTRSAEYSPIFLLVGLQVEHITYPFTYLVTIAFI